MFWAYRVVLNLVASMVPFRRRSWSWKNSPILILFRLTWSLILMSSF